MSGSVVVPARFNGPPGSAHGGYSAGLLGTLVDGPAEVALRRPPPLERPLTVERGPGGTLVAVDGDTEVLAARPARVAMEVPGPVSVAEAREAATRSSFLRFHPFPTCFACGPEREEGDGLRLFTGPVAGRDLFAVAWSPAEEFAADGEVEPLFVWAALDCPSSAPAIGEQPVVLASLAVELRAPVAAREPCVIGSWEIAREGRKRFSGVALWDDQGSLRALGRALWVELARR